MAHVDHEHEEERVDLVQPCVHSRCGKSGARLMLRTKKITRRAAGALYPLVVRRAYNLMVSNFSPTVYRLALVSHVKLSWSTASPLGV